MKKQSSILIHMLVALVFFVLALGSSLYFFYIIKTKNIHIEEISAEVDKETQKQDERAQLKRTIDATNADSEKLSTHFVDSKDAVSFLETLEGYGKKVGVAFKLGSADIDTKAKTMKVSFKATGEFEKVYQLLLLVENTPYQFSYDSIGITMATDQPIDLNTGLPLSSNPLWDLEITLNLISFNI
jgi:hypothetical protein